MFTGPFPWTMFNSGTYNGSIGAKLISGIPKIFVLNFELVKVPIIV